MSREARFIFGIGDILSVRVSCTAEECQNEMVYRVSEERSVYLECTPCREGSGLYNNNRPLERFLKLMRECTDIRFELPLNQNPLP